MRRLRRWATLAALQLLAALLLLELALRLLAPASAGVRSWTDAPQDDRDFARAATLPELLDMSALGFRPCREFGGFVTNSRGLRTPEYERDKPAGTYRVLAIGDSFAFASGGVPWPDLWTTRLQQLLQASRDGPVELINLGMPGVGTSFERRMWQLEGSLLQADLVVLEFYVGNDFRDEAWVPDGSFFSRYGRHSAVLRVLRNVVSGRELHHVEPGAVPAQAGAAEREGAPLPRGGYEVPDYRRIFLARRPLYTESQLLDVESRDMRVCDRAQAAVFAAMCARVEPVLAALAADVGASGAQLLVVVVPDRVQVNVAEREAVVAALHRPDSDFDWDAPQRWLVAVLARRGIPCLDLLPELRAAAARADGATGEAAGPLYAGDDTHWSPAGNALAAERIAAALQARGLPGHATSATGH